MNYICRFDYRKLIEIVNALLNNNISSYFLINFLHIKIAPARCCLSDTKSEFQIFHFDVVKFIMKCSKTISVISATVNPKKFQIWKLRNNEYSQTCNQLLHLKASEA